MLLPGNLLDRVTPWAGEFQTKLTPSWLFPTGAVTAHAAQDSRDEMGSEQTKTSTPCHVWRALRDPATEPWTYEGAETWIG